jgi:hypothetical protein
MRPPLLRVGHVSVVALALRAGPAFAEESSPVRLEYVAPEGCPDLTAVVEAIRARTPRLRLAGPSEPARLMRLRVASTASSFVGTLEVVGLDGTGMRREISAATCDTVVSAMSIVAALAIEPVAQATSASAVAPAAAPSAEPPLPVPEPPPMPAPRPVPTVTPSAPTAPALPLPPRQPDVKPRRWHLAVGALAEVLGLGAPGVAFAPAGVLELRLDSTGLVAPSVRLGFVRAEGGNVQAAGEDTTFTWLAGTAEACPVRVSFASTLALRPCAGLDAGAVSASTSGPSHALQPSRAWADARVEGRLEWRVLGSLSLELEGGLLVPLTRDRFEVAPSLQTAYEAPPATGVASVGALVQFW